MSETLLLHARTEPKRKIPWNRILLIVLFVLFFLAVLELIYSLVVMPNLTITNIEVHSDFAITEEDVLAVAGIEKNEYFFSLDCGAIQEKLLSFPLIREAEVTKVFPNTIKVRLRQRTPLFVSFGSLEGIPVPVAFDEEGVAFQIGRSISEWDLPVLSGLKFKPVLGMRLPELLYPLLQDLDNLKKNTPVLLDQISEIKVITSGNGSYELIAYPIDHNVKIVLGGDVNESVLKHVFLVLDVFKQQGLADRVQELDLRTGDVVYKLREE